ncbi:MAG: ATP-binding protein [Acidimicrobiales bacterium]
MDQCLDQARLADTRLAGDEKGAASTGCDVVETGSKLGQLVAPAEEGASRPGCRPAGQAGIGKTRLVEELVELAAATDVPCAWGRCWEGGGAPVYWPWQQVIRACVADAPTAVLAAQLGPGAADVAELAPELHARLPGLVATSPSPGPDARARLFDSVIGYLRAAARDRALIVALDDLHAADEPSLRLLVRLARELGDSRLLVVGTYRDNEVASSPRRQRLLADATRHGRSLSLVGVGEEGVAKLLARSVGADVRLAVIRRVHEVTDGNPFLALEMARQLRAAPGAGGVALPEDAHLLIGRHLESLEPPVTEVLSRAAVLGREFELSLLCTVDGRSVPAVIDDLQHAARAGIVEQSGLARWTFCHSLYRERLYDDLPAEARVAVHRRAAEELEERSGTDAVPVAELAHHFFRSARADGGAEAVRYCTRAGDAAMASLAFEEAAILYARALEALALAEHVDEQRRYDLSVSLGEARFRAGDLPGAREAHGTALAVARALGTPELVARAALGFAGMYESAQFADPSTTRLLEEALAALPAGDSPVRARILVALAGRQLAAHSPWEVIAGLSRQGLDMARRLGEAEALDGVLWEWHRNVFFAPETLEERVAVAEELVASATRTGNRECLIRAIEWRAADRFEMGDVPGAASDLEMAEREARDLRLPLLLWAATFPKVAIALLHGHFAEAERFARQALEAGERSEFMAVEMNYIGQLMAIRRQQGRFRELEDLTRRHSEEYAWKPDDSRWVVRALVLAELGLEDQARALFDSCADAALANSRAAGLRVLSFVADACWLLGDRERAGAVHEALLPYPGRHVLDGIAAYSLGSSDRSLAQTAALLERWDEAEEHFESAQHFHEQVGARVWAAHTRVDQATMLLRRRRPGDERRAADLLDAAAAAYRAMGLKLQLERVARMQPQAASAPGGGPPASGVWSRDGDHWIVEYAGVVVRLSDSKGLRYLTRLLRNPNRRFYALELAEEESVGGDAERARQAVRRALVGALARLAAAHPVLGEHFRTTVRSGMYSSYDPDPRAPVDWKD